MGPHAIAQLATWLIRLWDLGHHCADMMRCWRLATRGRSCVCVQFCMVETTTALVPSPAPGSALSMDSPVYHTATTRSVASCMRLFIPSSSCSDLGLTLLEATWLAEDWRFGDLLSTTWAASAWWLHHHRQGTNGWMNELILGYISNNNNPLISPLLGLPWRSSTRKTFSYSLPLFVGVIQCLIINLLHLLSLHCFDALGWTEGKASGL